MMVEKSPCGCNDFLLLAGGHAGGRATVVAVAAQADFDKEQQPVFAGDQVDFTVAAAVVGGDHAEALACQELGSGLFSRLSRRQRRGAVRA